MEAIDFFILYCWLVIFNFIYGFKYQEAFARLMSAYRTATHCFPSPKRLRPEGNGELVDKGHKQRASLCF